MQTTTDTQAWYASQFELLERALNGEAASPLHRLRREAIDRFQAAGFPTTRNEEWRFTNVAPIAKLAMRPVIVPSAGALPADVVSQIAQPGQRGPRLVFVNGHYAPEYSHAGSLPAGVRVESLAAALKRDQAVDLLSRRIGPEDDAFTSLNTAFLKDGAFVYLPDGAALEDPVHLIFVSGHETPPFLSSPRNVIVAGARTRFSIVERYVGLTADDHLTNAVTDFIVGDDADAEHDSLQEEGSKAFHVGSTRIALGRNTRFTSNAVSFGGLLVRNNVTALFTGEGSECTLNGLMLATARQHMDTHTTIDHARAHCASHELYKAILGGHARGVFNGKIFVRKDAQKTDAKQTNKTLLLSDDATINTKPQLEIFADDVKCTHGATVGQLDEEQVFYLRTRGIDLASARDLLTHAFASDVIRRVRDDNTRDQLAGLLRARLEAGRSSGEGL